MRGRWGQKDGTPTRLEQIWDIVFSVLTGLCAFSILISTDDSNPARLSSFAAAMGLLATYWVLSLRGRRTGWRWEATYLTLMVVVVAFCSGASSQGTLLLFVGYTQIWALTEKLRVGARWSILLTVAVGVALALRQSSAGFPWGSLTDGDPLTGAQWGSLVGQLGVVLLFTLALGWWTDRAYRQRVQRAHLLSSLHAAEDEIATGHRAAGVLAERARVAQEVHDTLAQGFTSVVMLAQTAQAQIANGMNDAAAGRLVQVEHVARDNLAEARALVAAFGPAGLAESGLIAAVQRVADRFATETAVTVHVELAPGAEPANRDTQVVLLRTVQEALSNVRKHAAATTVWVTLARSGERLVLTVADDGQGLAPGTAEGVGLRGMRERIEAAGGRLILPGEVSTDGLDDRPQTGTVIQAELPGRDAEGLHHDD